MTPKISNDLRLTFPIRWAERPPVRDPAESDAEWAERSKFPDVVPLVWLYHTPISREVFEANWRVISATSSTLLKKDVSPAVLGIATLALRDAGRRDALEYGLPEGLSLEKGGTAEAILTEIRRLTLVCAPGPTGYEMVPVEIAIARSVIDSDDWTEAEASLVFFTCGYSIADRRVRRLSAEPLASVLLGSITSSTVSEFVDSLNASMPPTTSVSAATTNPSSVPS